MVNTNKIKAKIKYLNLTIEGVAFELGVAPYTLSLKINNKRKFTASEAIKTCEILGIPFSEIKDYFNIEREDEELQRMH